MQLSPALGEWLRAMGHDAFHASERGMYRCSDEELIDFAGADDRVIIRADLDFPRLINCFKRSGPGVILLRGGNYNEADSLECVRRVLLATPNRDLSGLIVVVDRKRIRRRTLPLT